MLKSIYSKYVSNCSSYFHFQPRTFQRKIQNLKIFLHDFKITGNTLFAIINLIGKFAQKKKMNRHMLVDLCHSFVEFYGFQINAYAWTKVQGRTASWGGSDTALACPGGGESGRGFLCLHCSSALLWTSLIIALDRNKVERG